MLTTVPPCRNPPFGSKLNMVWGKMEAPTEPHSWLLTATLTRKIAFNASRCFDKHPSILVPAKQIVGKEQVKNDVFVNLAGICSKISGWNWQLSSPFKKKFEPQTLMVVPPVAETNDGNIFSTIGSNKYKKGIKLRGFSAEAIWTDLVVIANLCCERDAST